MVIDLTTEEEYATFLLTQLSEKEPSIYVLNEKESIVHEREMYRGAWAAPATPAKAPVSQDLSGIPSPFARAAFEEQPKKKVKKEVQVKEEMQCYRYDYAIKKNAVGGQRRVTCVEASRAKGCAQGSRVICPGYLPISSGPNAPDIRIGPNAPDICAVSRGKSG